MLCGLCRNPIDGDPADRLRAEPICDECYETIKASGDLSG